jgi:hypothetical protein
MLPVVLSSHKPNDKPHKFDGPAATIPSSITEPPPQFAKHHQAASLQRITGGTSIAAYRICVPPEGDGGHFLCKSSRLAEEVQSFARFEHTLLVHLDFDPLHEFPLIIVEFCKSCNLVGSPIRLDCG